MGCNEKLLTQGYCGLPDHAEELRRRIRLLNERGLVNDETTAAVVDLANKGRSHEVRIYFDSERCGVEVLLFGQA